VSLSVVWHRHARRDLLNIPWQDAAWVVREVDRLAEDGVGDVRTDVFPSGSRMFVLMLPGYRVFVTFDRSAGVVHVWEVWRSIRPVGA
jgi:hypothetical protein